jgi:hypothetical protein
VQLIYALHEAGLINNGKGEITKITEALAETLELDLGLLILQISLILKCGLRQELN